MKTTTETNVLDLLADAWQHRDHSIRVTVTAVSSPRPSARRRTMAEALCLMAVSLAALVCLVLIYDDYVVDFYDLVSHLLVGLVFVGIVAYAFRASVRVGSRQSSSPVVTRIEAITAVAALCIVLATPAYDGRTMSAYDGDRSQVIAGITNTIHQLQNQTA